MFPKMSFQGGVKPVVENVGVKDKCLLEGEAIMIICLHCEKCIASKKKKKKNKAATPGSEKRNLLSLAPKVGQPNNSHVHSLVQKIVFWPLHLISP